MIPQLNALVVERQIRSDQAQFIHEKWSESPSELWAHPAVRALNEHTRSYLDQLRGHFSLAAARCTEV